jgi:hypothetical protein
MAPTRTTPPQELTRTAFPTSTYPQASSKTTRTRAHDGTPRCRLTGMRTTARPKPSQRTTRSKSPSLYLSIFTDCLFRDPVEWLSFVGHWGDKQYPDDDESQFCFLGIDALCEYTNGPTGPIDKQLQREKVCPDNGIPCIVRKFLVQRAADDEPATTEGGM